MKSFAKMRNTHTYLILLVLMALVFSSCNKETDSPDPVNNTIEDVKVPEDFTFETTFDYSIELQVPVSEGEKYKRVRFFIYDIQPEDGVNSGLIASGGVNETGVYSTLLSLPYALDSVFVGSNMSGLSLGMVKVEKTGLQYQFSAPNLKNVFTKSASDSKFDDIISDFENGIDGWLPDGDQSIALSSHADAPLENGPLGSNDQYLWGWDSQGGLRFFKAPEKFSGNIYGQYLAYHYYLGNTDQARPVQKNLPDIKITDGNKVLCINLSPSFIHETNAGWQTYYVKLDETATTGTDWRIGGMSYLNQRNGTRALPGKRATTTEIQQVMSNATEVYLAPEGQVGYYSSKGPEFIALGKVGIVQDLESFFVVDQGETPEDTDGDGVPDQNDDYPSDEDLAYNNYSPSEGTWGTLAYEDLWPEKGDYDFNDLVLDYQFNMITGADNKVKKIVIHTKTNAVGAGFRNGFAFAFDNLEKNNIESVSGSILEMGLFEMANNGVEAENDVTVIPVFDNAFSLFPTDEFVNTENGSPYYTPAELDIEILLEEGVSIASLGTAPFNPFIVSNQERGREVHLAGLLPTSMADAALFGTGNDDTQIGSKYYQSEIGLPWGIHLPQSFDYPYEKISIEKAHLKFVDWVESNGVQYPDWYMDKNGYRDDQNIYQP
jgi:LruC domain-containing protein